MSHQSEIEYHKLLAITMSKLGVSSLDIFSEDVPPLSGKTVICHAQKDRLTLHLMKDADANAFVAAHSGEGVSN